MSLLPFLVFVILMKYNHLIVVTVVINLIGLFDLLGLFFFFNNHLKLIHFWFLKALTIISFALRSSIAIYLNPFFFVFYVRIWCSSLADKFWIFFANCSCSLFAIVIKIRTILIASPKAQIVLNFSNLSVFLYPL